MIPKQQLKQRKKWEKLGIRIPKKLRDIIHGYMMSDGYIRNGMLTVDQGEGQKNFVEWLYKEFETIRTPKEITKVTRTHPKTKKVSRSYRFFTKAVLQGFHHIWYEPFIDKTGVLRYRKKVPKSIDCFFNETFISLWFAGDGTKIIGSVGAKFEVTAFTPKERQKLKSLFLTKFGINTKIILSGRAQRTRKGNPQWALKIPAEEYPKFRNLITKIDLIPKVFPYKLHKKL